MVCLPYNISCNGTCFVHEIFRLDAIERYIVTIYHIVAKNGFPKYIFSQFTEGLDLYCPITGLICLPQDLFSPISGILCPRKGTPYRQYWSCALNMMMQSSICRQANHIRHSKIRRFLYKYKLEKYIHNCA